MKPTEHEFKVMGLAGYALEKNIYYEKSLKIFRDTLDIKELNLNIKKKLKTIIFILKIN